MPSSRSHNDASSAQQAMKEVYAESQLYLTIKGYFRQPTEEESWDKDIIATPKMEMLLQRDDREQYLVSVYQYANLVLLSRTLEQAGPIASQLPCLLFSLN